MDNEITNINADIENIKKEVRNVKRVTDTEIVCELKHPIYGWIPYTAIKDSGEEEMEEIWQEHNKKTLKYDVEIIRDRVVSETTINIINIINDLKHKYSEDERSLWDLKRNEAEKILLGQPSTIISLEAQLSGETDLELAKKIVEKSDNYRNKVIVVEALKRNVEKDSANLTTLKEVKSFEAKYNKIIEDL